MRGLENQVKLTIHRSHDVKFSLSYNEKFLSVTAPCWNKCFFIVQLYRGGKVIIFMRLGTVYPIKTLLEILCSSDSETDRFEQVKL